MTFALKSVYTFTFIARNWAESNPNPMLADRKLMHGSGGYIGTVLQPTQEGDEVCMLLGCHTALVLRRIRNNTFHIVGECYVPGVMEGEAILGPLPDSIRRIFAVDKKWGVYSQFLNTKSQSIQRTDLRLQSLILETQDFSKSLSNNPNIKLKLKAQDIYSTFPQLQTFYII